MKKALSVFTLYILACAGVAIAQDVEIPISVNLKQGGGGSVDPDLIYSENIHVSDGNLIFPFIDGTPLSVTLPPGQGGSADGVISALSLAVNPTSHILTVTATRTVGDPVVGTVDLSTVHLSGAEIVSAINARLGSTAWQSGGGGGGGVDAQARARLDAIEADGWVVESRIRDDAVTGRKIPAKGIGGGLIGDNTIEARSIRQGSIGSREIAGLGVATGDLANQAVSQEKLAKPAVGPAELRNLTVGPDKLTAALGGDIALNTRLRTTAFRESPRTDWTNNTTVEQGWFQIFSVNQGAIRGPMAVSDTADRGGSRATGTSDSYSVTIGIPAGSKVTNFRITVNNVVVNDHQWSQGETRTIGGTRYDTYTNVGGMVLAPSGGTIRIQRATHYLEYLDDVPTPTRDFAPATKKYVDDNAGGGGTAELTLLQQIALLDMDLRRSAFNAPTGPSLSTALQIGLELRVNNPGVVTRDAWFDVTISGISLRSRTAWSRTSETLSLTVTSDNADLIVLNEYSDGFADLNVNFYDAASAGNRVAQHKMSVQWLGPTGIPNAPAHTNAAQKLVLNVPANAGAPTWVPETTGGRGGITQTQADNRYLRLVGGTLTGALKLNGAPTDDLHAATKKYVDDNAGGGSSGSPRLLSGSSPYTITANDDLFLFTVSFGTGGAQHGTLVVPRSDLGTTAKRYTSLNQVAGAAADIYWTLDATLTSATSLTVSVGGTGASLESASVISMSGGSGEESGSSFTYFDMGALVALNFSNSTDTTDQTGSYSFKGGGVTGTGLHRNIDYRDLKQATIRLPSPSTGTTIIVADFNLFNTAELRAAINGVRFYIANTGSGMISFDPGGIASVFPTGSTIPPGGVAEVFVFANAPGTTFSDGSQINLIVTPHDEEEPGWRTPTSNGSNRWTVNASDTEFLFEIREGTTDHYYTVLVPRPLLGTTPKKFTLDSNNPSSDATRPSVGVQAQLSGNALTAVVFRDNFTNRQYTLTNTLARP